MVSKESFVERQTLRAATFIIALYCVLSGIQMLVSYEFFDYSNWIITNLNSGGIGYFVMIVPIFLGVGLATGKIFHKQLLITYGLGLISIFQIGLAVFNGIAYDFQASPAVPALTIGILALLLAGYYIVRDVPKSKDKDLQQ